MWDISTGMCLMTLVSPLVFFLAVIAAYVQPVLMKCIILHAMFSREARVLITQMLEIQFEWLL